MLGSGKVGCVDIERANGRQTGFRNRPRIRLGSGGVGSTGRGPEDPEASPSTFYSGWDPVQAVDDAVDLQHLVGVGGWSDRGRIRAQRAAASRGRPADRIARVAKARA